MNESPVAFTDLPPLYAVYTCTYIVYILVHIYSDIMALCLPRRQVISPMTGGLSHRLETETNSALPPHPWGVANMNRCVC